MCRPLCVATTRVRIATSARGSASSSSASSSSSSASSSSSSSSSAHVAVLMPSSSAQSSQARKPRQVGGAHRALSGKASGERDRDATSSGAQRAHVRVPWRRMLSRYSPLVSQLRKQWFMVGVCVVIALAHFNPSLGRKGGPLRPEVTVKVVAVAIIFLNSGLSLRTAQLRAALFKFKVHGLIQGFSFLGIPLVLFCLVSLLEVSGLHEALGFREELLRGIKVVACMPPPVSSAVILTKAVGGDEAAVIFNSTLGSFVGVVLTPTMLLMLVGVSASVPVVSIVTKMSLTVLLPILVGQALQKVVGSARLRAMNIPFGTVNSCVLLLIIYTVFCDTFLRDTSVEMRPLIMTAIIVVLAQLLFMRMLLYIARLVGISPTDSIACLFAGSHKSLTLGIPMINIMFAGDPNILFYSLPLLLYHPSQILVGSTLVAPLKEWLDSKKSDAVVASGRPERSLEMGAM